MVPTILIPSLQCIIKETVKVYFYQIVPESCWNRVRKSSLGHFKIDILLYQSISNHRLLYFHTTVAMAAARSLRKRPAPEIGEQPEKRSRQSKTQHTTKGGKPGRGAKQLTAAPSVKQEVIDNVVKDEDASGDLKHIPRYPTIDRDGDMIGSTRRMLRPRRSAVKPSYTEEESFEDEKPARESTGKQKKQKVEIKNQEEEELPKTKSPRKPSKKTKANPYGLTPGITPFPEWEAPSADACEEVYRLLASLHGDQKAPDKIPAPSLEVSGCGEAPSVIDALVRTRLSANTSNSNSSAAFRGLVDRFGVVKEGIGKGSVDWDKVRQAPLGDIVQAIKCGGLAQIKGRDIKNILEMVYEENKARREAFLAEKTSGKAASILGASGKTQGQKDLEILKAEENLISLDHIHGMQPDEAMLELTKFPGIGVKTASCVILFCLRQPSFAVDTHVHRISGWLKWIPPKATRDEAFSHLEVRIPNHLKYGLHKLFVQHGRSCLKCRANTSIGTEGWDDTDCPLEDVIDRVGKKSGSGRPKASKKSKEEDEIDD